MKDLAGKDISVYFPPPIGVGCAGLGTNNRMQMRYANATSAAAFPQAVHWSSELAVWTGTELSRDDWYNSIFLKKMNEFYKGPVVWIASRFPRLWTMTRGKSLPDDSRTLRQVLTPVHR